MGALLTALLDSFTSLRYADAFLIHFWCNALLNVFDGAIREKLNYSKTVATLNQHINQQNTNLFLIDSVIPVKVRFDLTQILKSYMYAS